MMSARAVAVNISTCLLTAFLLGILIPGQVRAQDFRNNQFGNQDPFGQNPYGQNQNNRNRNGNSDYMNQMGQLGANPFASEPDSLQKADTTKKRKPRKPLESYFFDDSTRNRPNFAWNVDTYRNRITMVDIDTLMDNFNTDYPYLRKGVGDAYQGNLGGATIPLNYHDRPRYENASFAQAYATYHVTPETAMFYNVKRPFSQFDYQWGGQKKYLEEKFAIRHAQNISPSSGFNLNYDSRGTRGIYANHRGRAKNLSMAFSHTGKKYSIHAGYIYNATLNKENGGVTDDDHIIHNNDYEYEIAENIPVWLTDARNRIKNNTYYVIQSYGVPLRKLSESDFSIADQSSVFIGHSFQYNRWHRNYTDTKSGMSADNIPGDDNNIERTKYFYDNWFINPVETRDSLFESVISNRVFVQIQPWDRNGVIGTIDAGIGMDNHLYYQFRPWEYMQGESKTKKTSYYLYGSIEGKIKEYVGWGADAKIHPTGYRSGEMHLGGHLSLDASLFGRPFRLEGKIFHERRAPDFWSQNYFSNHFAWSNSFDKEDETRIEASFKMPSRNFEVGFSQSLVKNKVYYDETMHPKQHSGNVSVTGLYLLKNFRAGGFHFNHRVLLQWSNAEEIIPVPEASAYLSYYFEFNVVKDVLRMQTGIDGRYNTLWYAPGWNPATATFYNQRDTQVGEYPMLDFFVNMKWKRMRILLKVQHLNEDLIGDRKFFSLPHNPLNTRVFKIGISWSFYD